MVSRRQLHAPTIFWRTFSALCLLLAGCLLEVGAAHGQGIINEYVGICDASTPSQCEKVSSQGAALVAPPDAVTGPNTSLSNGTVTNGLFSSGTVTNPSNGQILIGPFNTGGALSGAFEYVFTSGTPNTIIFQESPSPSGPWTNINFQSSISQFALMNSFASGSNASIRFPISQLYMQIVNNSSNAQVYSLAGYLRSVPFTSTLTTPASYDIVVTSSVGSFSSGTYNVPRLSSTGYQVVLPYSTPELTWNWSTAGTPITTATTTTVQAAQGAGVRNYMTGLSCVNNSTTGTEIQILDGSTVIYDDFALPNNVTGGGDRLQPPLLIPLRGSAATAMSLKTFTTGASLYCSAQGYGAT